MRLLNLAPVLMLAISTAVIADNDAERTALAKIIHELDAIKPLIQTARAQANPDARIQFQYDWLALDIQRIQSGIREHLAAPQTQPRQFPPLKGDYRH
jgi:RAQPRD family integrative conjugative element protein